MKNILVLDHSDDVLEMFSFVFKHKGFKIATCNCIKSLFANLQTEIPDLLILDVMHSQISKEFICDDLRTRNSLKNLPILITSTKAEHIKYYEDFCANDSLEKPFDVSTLIEKVKALLSPVYLK